MGRSASRIAPAGLVALALVGCESGVARAPTTPTTNTPSVTGVSIAGLSARLAIGQTAQLSASVALSNGSQKALAPDDVSWQSSDPAVATVSAAGLATVIGLGQTDIRAAFRDLKGSARVIATIDIAGIVHETPPLDDVVVPGANVIIASGARAGESTLTDGAGRFAFGQIEAPGFTLRVSRDGYEDASFGVSALPRDVNPDIRLNPLPAERSWSGRFDGGRPLNEVFQFETHRPGPITLAIRADCGTQSTVEPLGLFLDVVSDPRASFCILLGTNNLRDITQTQVLPPGRYVVRAYALSQTRQGCPWRMAVQFPR